ncbi:MAG TPA: 16S rRNA (cytosine(967)-C(5))-methyltransferase RsmB [Terracidiphilus sp.]|nr:16S rRNA (cytosine(967)-C(5))-methyltransferase RsmB [Terracidiphilus sp.]
MTAVAGVSPARRAAFQILLRMERASGHADDLLRGREVSALSAADRHLATALVLGVLRWQLWLDQQIRAHLDRPNAKLEPEVRLALRMGVFQLLSLDRIPAHAAIDESVELVKRAGHRFASGMVNAVLRKVAQQETLHGHAADAAAVEAHPAWMVERWMAQFGEGAARTICRHGQAQPEPVVRVESAEDEEEMARKGIELAPGTLLACARLVKAGDVTATAAFREGRVHLQDEGSQLIAELAATSLNRGQEKILDACAAPGGKARILAERLPRARILALEASASRLALLRERLAAYADRVEFRHADAAALEETSAFDLALVDAPCSGTGTLGRNPEIRHRLRAEDLARHAERQEAILRAALRAVRPDGFVVYATCSLEPEENEHVAAAVLAEMRDARQVSLAPQIDTLLQRGILTHAGAERLRPCLTPEGAVRLIPGAVHTDGFFAALIEKKP